MSLFDRAWDLVKMPFVPGSIRPVEGKFKEGDDDHAPAQIYEGDFYDPVDDITRLIEIDPMREWVGEEENYFGNKHRNMDRVEAAFIDLRDEEGREPEMAFGLEQANPFATTIDNKLERVFVPSDLRERGIGSGLLDALHEYRSKYGRQSRGIPMSNEVSEKMLNVLASRNLFPNELAKLPEGMSHDPNEEYFHSGWRTKDRWPGSKEEAPPRSEWFDRWKEAGQRHQERMQMEAEWEDEEDW